MTIEIQNGFKYNLQTFSGDSGSVTISGLPTDSQNYIVYLEIKGKVRIEKSVALNGASLCVFSFTPAETESLGVGSWEYGVKICDSTRGIEDTLIPDLRASNKATFTVYPERVKGTANG